MVVQRLKDQAPSAEGGVQSLVWELGSYMAQGAGKNKKMKNIMQSFEKDVLDLLFFQLTK